MNIRNSVKNCALIITLLMHAEYAVSTTNTVDDSSKKSGTPSLSNPQKNKNKKTKIINLQQDLVESDSINIDTMKKDNNTEEEEEIIEFQFEAVGIDQLIAYMSELYGITFITNDTINPLPQGEKSLKGHKVSFRTNYPLTKTEAWDLFLTFLDLAGFAVVPEADPTIMRIISSTKSKTEPVPTFIGTSIKDIPDNDQVIRYVYYVHNRALDTLKPIVDQIKSAGSEVIALQDHKAFLIIDKAYNVRSLVELLTELDRVSMPPAMSIIQLHRADAEEVKELYEAIAQDPGAQPRVFPARKKATSLYFPEDVRIIAEKRRNTLILFGPKDALKKIEEFITKYVDVDISQAYSALYVYNLQYAEANAIAEIMKTVTAFGKSTSAGQVGGVRSGDKFFRPITFTPEPETNRLIIKGDYEDYLKAKTIIEQLDEPQPQVNVEVLILGLSLIDTKVAGAQIRNKEPLGINGLLGDTVKFQTSGLRTGAGLSQQGIVTRDTGTGVERLLGDLIALASGAPAGSTLISLGDQLGVWAIFQLLDTITATDVIATPFITVTNKTKGKISIGEARRVVTSTVIGGGAEQDAFSTENANLTLDIIPQINSDGMIILDLKVSIDRFIGESDPFNVAKNTQEVITKTIVADGEVLALGGLIRTNRENAQSSTPLLGRIPGFGWLFKNRSARDEDEHLLILISTHIVPPDEQGRLSKNTQEHVAEYYTIASAIKREYGLEDPINKFFFDGTKNTDTIMDNFMLARGKIRKKTNSKKTKKRTRTAKRKRNQNKKTVV